ncbi:MAG: 2,3-bisphosphoglycerate-independent phosphoglycerate mutase [Thermodesulfobacteriota bacterium]
MAEDKKKPLLLLILDGWGYAPAGPGNAVSQAATPNMDRLLAENGFGLLQACGEAVGLPPGQMGNSEVGHLNLGAGRVVYQDIMRINMAVQDGSLAQNKVLDTLFGECNGRVHFMGLLSDGGVHSHQRHLEALLDIARKKGVPSSFVHCFMDGRDTSPHSGKGYLKKLTHFMRERAYGKIASICGRFYAMDRDKRWERTEAAYNALVMGEGERTSDVLRCMDKYYQNEVTDEFIPPTMVRDMDEDTDARIRDGDGVIFFNFRADRARQLTNALYSPDFDKFDRETRPRVTLATMTRYDAHFPLPVLFAPQRLKNILAEVFANSGFTQLRLAETEKYAHVTYFFNGGEEKSFPGEDRTLVASPREVATYDQKPEMSVYEITDILCSQLRARSHDLYVCNFANLDMVGHTGDMEAVIRACEVVDECLGRVINALEASGVTAIITADHGNADDMLDEAGNPKTAHSLNPVPVILYPERPGLSLAADGVLGDVAPTLLFLAGLDQPPEMTGKMLVNRN